MNLVRQIIFYANMIFICLIISLAIVAGILLYFIKIKKITAKKENIDTSYFKKEDTLSYVPLKDVLYQEGMDSAGMIAVTDRHFVAGISIQGFNYGSAAAEKRLAAIVNSISFFSVVEDPISFRGTSKKVDLSCSIEEYQGVLKNLGMRLAELDEEYQAALSASEKYVEQPEEYRQYEKRMKDLQRQIAAGNHQVLECRTLIGYMEAMVKDSQKMSNKNSTYSQLMFSYVFNPDQYNNELTKEEIYLKAQEALKLKETVYSDALATCGFKTKRLSAKELVQLIRKHNFPLTGQDDSIEEVLDSSYTSLFVTSDSLVETQKEKIGEEAYRLQMQKYEEELELLRQRMKEQMEQRGDKIGKDSYEKAVDELEGMVQVR